MQISPLVEREFDYENSSSVEEDEEEEGTKKVVLAARQWSVKCFFLLKRQFCNFEFKAPWPGPHLHQLLILGFHSLANFTKGILKIQELCQKKCVVRERQGGAGWSNLESDPRFIQLPTDLLSGQLLPITDNNGYLGSSETDAAA